MIEQDIAALERHLAELEASVHDASREALTSSARRWQEILRRESSRVGGELAASWQLEERRTEEGGEARIGSPLRYAAIQSTGGRIRSSRWMAIPLRADLRGRSPRTMPLHVRRSRAGRLLLFAGRGGPPLYLLTREVQIPATRYLERAHTAGASDVQDILRAAVSSALTQ